MTPEEFQKYKEAEKQHLRKLKELKKAVRRLEREKSIRSAFENVSAEPTEVMERQKDLVDRLAMETAMHEARLEMVLDGSEDLVRESRTAALEEELQRERAQALVRQLGKEMKEESADKEKLRRADGDPGTSKAPTSSNPTSSRDDRPEKTIGRM